MPEKALDAADGFRQIVGVGQNTRLVIRPRLVETRALHDQHLGERGELLVVGER